MLIFLSYLMFLFLLVRGYKGKRNRIVKGLRSFDLLLLIVFLCIKKFVVY